MFDDSYLYINALNGFDWNWLSVKGGWGSRCLSIVSSPLYDIDFSSQLNVDPIELGPLDLSPPKKTFTGPLPLEGLLLLYFSVSLKSFSNSMSPLFWAHRRICLGLSRSAVPIFRLFFIGITDRYLIINLWIREKHCTTWWNSLKKWYSFVKYLGR